jgi:hypothetical protein
MQVTDPWAVSLVLCVQGAAALIHSLAGEPRDEAVEWVLKYAQNAKVNYRVGGLTVLAALLDMPGGKDSLCCGRREMVRLSNWSLPLQKRQSRGRSLSLSLSSAACLTRHPRMLFPGERQCLVC